MTRNGDSCQSTAAERSGSSFSERRHALKGVFNSFWPAGSPFPPMVPWLAASVTRAEAFAWALDLGVLDRNEVLSGSPSDVLHFIGLAMGADGEYARKRKKEKKKKRPELPPVETCWWEDDGQGGWRWCCISDEGGGKVCTSGIGEPLEVDSPSETP